jgi:hypothetical protein
MPGKKKLTEKLSAAGAALRVGEESAVKKATAPRRTSASSAKKAESAAPKKPRVRKTNPASVTASAPREAAVAAAPASLENIGSILSQGVSLREHISLLAYSYWQQRGYQGGSPEEDWFRAEQEIQRRLLNGEDTL